ncbi:MAG: HI0074 family nucleotidyltransferase substrate-binding subunit, partial [Acidobacteriota bacterium]|nr:HI0074 family nucleotidyltransferase substrate-binding subunit [Acidobacteriota bacterium]
ERLRLKYQDAFNALKTVADILKEPFSMIIRDATIQRFEYTFEALWKFLKEYLKEKEGIVSNSPKACFKEIFSLGFLTEEETVRCLEMTDRRNDTFHTYKEEVAKLIYSKIKGYYTLMKNLLDQFEEKIEDKSL